MCGIAGIYLKPNSRIRDKEVQSLADNLLAELDHRGGDATGYLVRNREGQYYVEKAACAAKDFLRERSEFPTGVQSVLLHTRFATQGHQGFLANNHPVHSGNFYVVHNGHITNDDELCKKFGFPRLGRVDSEAIAHIFRAKGLNSAQTVMEKIEGAAAIAVMDVSNGEIVLARGASSPLTIVETDSLIVWASEMIAIRDAWANSLGTPPAYEKFVYVSEGTSIHLKPNGEKVTRKFTVPEDKWWRTVDAYDYDYEWKVTYKDGRSVWYKELKDKSANISLPAASCDTNILEEFADCDCCDEEYMIAELYEIYPGFSICPHCERTLDELTPEGSSIEDTVEIAKWVGVNNIHSSETERDDDESDNQ